MALRPDNYVTPIPTKVSETKRIENYIDERLRTKQYHQSGHRAVIYAFGVAPRYRKEIRDLYVAAGWVNVVFSDGDKRDGGLGASVTLVGK